MQTKYSHLTQYEFTGLVAKALDTVIDPEARELVQEILNRLDAHPTDACWENNPDQLDLFPN